MSQPVKVFERILAAQRVANRFAMEFPTEKAKAKYLKDHPDADKSKHTVKKDEPTEATKSMKDFQDAGSKSKAEHVEGVGHHMAPGGVIPLKEHNPEGIAKKHTKDQIEKSLEAVKSRLKHVHGDDAKQFEKTQETLEKALKLKAKKSEDFTPEKSHAALGGKLQEWHGPGTPALNEVGSHLTGGKPFPRKRIEEAARELEKMKDHPSSTDKDKKDLDDLVMKLWRLDR
jgi:hypothetical protein